MIARQAYEAMLTLRKWCRQQGKTEGCCDACIFRSGRKGNVMTSCKVGNGDIPEFWDINHVKERVKQLEGEQE